MPVVNFLACLDLEQNTLFLDRHCLTKLNNLISITFHLLGTEVFEKCSSLIEFKEGDPALAELTAGIL